MTIEGWMVTLWFIRSASKMTLIARWNSYRKSRSFGSGWNPTRKEGCGIHLIGPAGSNASPSPAGRESARG